MRGLPGEDFIVINRIAFSFLAALLVGNAFAQDLTDAQRADIEERIKPVGESCLEGDSNCGSPAVAEASSEARSGEEVYNAACMACHSTGAAGAPKYGDATAWAERIAKGMDALYSGGIDGVAGTGMMAKGGCMNCSDEEVTAAVDYMVAGSQ
jgi:cytochrome c5